MLKRELKSEINKLWEKFWSNGISNPLTAIEQMSYLLFLKRMDVEDTKKLNATKYNYKLNYISLFKGHENCRWSKWSTMEGKEMFEHIDTVIFPFLKELGKSNSLYEIYMKDATFAIPNASLLVEAVSIINNIIDDSLCIGNTNYEVKGDIYEYLLSELNTAGKNGQFRTPRHIIKMITEIVDPQIGETICDPTCGTAGFLVSAYKYILLQNSSKDNIKYDEEGNPFDYIGDKLSENELMTLKTKMLYGSEFDQTMVRIALMNLIIHGIESPNIFRKNSLVDRNDYNENNIKYDVILANPPFKGTFDKKELSNRFTINTTKTELLFLELIYNLLKDGGRCAVIVPDGVLFGSSRAHKKIREILLNECGLEAVISMPSGVFKPYTGVSTAILYFIKGESTKKVWFYDMTDDGYTLDDKRNFIDGNGDMTDIVKSFRERYNQEENDRKSKHFFVPFEEIKKNNYDLSILKYKEIEYQISNFDKPEIILKRIKDLDNEIKKNFEELNVLMKK
ncbi:type I restriction enzyme M protein [Methanococcus voltae]|uniref:site-specific DNA-methyltransferase (adenine-specific) n=2 Tax=Methanococcus voltae TaxID=2188 RepID=A0A8J7S2R9_METVO|nr:type I restriction-modification system subunit M [Methanococcus voltae]MBP2202265.1 type I restriction enzyme M protein [Methanococcus voltae]MCS3922950.1 type I restriction enzyme M protein [Methanococcus voltae PS]